VSIEREERTRQLVAAKDNAIALVADLHVAAYGDEVEARMASRRLSGRIGSIQLRIAAADEATPGSDEPNWHDQMAGARGA